MNEETTTMETSSDVRTEEETTTFSEITTSSIEETTTASVAIVETIDYTSHIETLTTVNLSILAVLTFILGYMMVNSFFNRFK